ncbi:hypothetical protein KP509_29G070100 [Ceratopteris richardii]|uniref:Phosphofructokinase domain-containing protein n=1 Tax=Ceratopteris richardii TaxID=49495 RepID=A0A8T2RAA0_CERRI|nr:hypothetical protein KP509_29G070100 [Ceratopteris richardii]
MACAYFSSFTSIDKNGRYFLSAHIPLSFTTRNRGKDMVIQPLTLRDMTLYYKHKKVPQSSVQKLFQAVMGDKHSILDEPVFDDVPHLTDWLPELEAIRHSLQNLNRKQYFVNQNEVVAKNVVEKFSAAGDGIYFRRAGPTEKVYFKPDEVNACIVTCGGLCPGVNTIIREIVYALWNQFGVESVFGMEGGYPGFYARNTIQLNLRVVDDIHKRGGTILGTSYGDHHTFKIVNSIQDRRINQVYIVGGRSTHKEAHMIYEEVRRRGLKVSIAGIPKSVDNDIDIIDRSLGFDTAVEEAQRAISAAHVEAESVHNGIGLVKLMGRHSGHIAMYATLASRDVDCCLIPEASFYLEGQGGLYEYIERCLHENKHIVIVVAEALFADPTYMIRAVPSNASDNIYCTLLAQSAVNGAMAGYSGFVVGPVNGQHAYIPAMRITENPKRISIIDRMWARLLSSTNQPDFRQVKKLKNERFKASKEIELMYIYY